ncbi:hypothetical protein IGS68_07230 [Skermanella sp. TT6]|uniref:DUF4351 domain-containing protein n=1 Tax=Skermanella cutis TaxID=2775420 RepID=A0ABX7B9H4_9PROT|nr:hypothetical protein [Skermanella sp. TT6]QQP91003.1 hypothetical protein IGS68_07230 [Skermanella sp. TT6]
MAEGKAEVLLRMVQRQLGTVPTSVEQAVKSALAADIDGWIEAMLDDRPLDELFPEITH